MIKCKIETDEQNNEMFSTDDEDEGIEVAPSGADSSSN